MNKKKWIIGGSLLAVLLLLAVCFGGNHGEFPEEPLVSAQSQQSQVEQQPKEELLPPAEEKVPENSSEELPALQEKEAKAPEKEGSPSAEKPVAKPPVKPPEKEEARPPVRPASPAPPSASVCTISISCATALNHLDQCKPGVASILPSSGWFLPATQVDITPGESVLEVLRRVCRERNIHLEYTETPAYGNAYIEGIGNLYEFDVGELSGWMYQVNGKFPNYGCSSYSVQAGDVICWVYTCDQGADVGGSNAAS